MKFTEFLESLLLLFLGCLFCMAMYEAPKRHNNMVAELTKREIAGIIIYTKYASKETLYLRIDDRISKVKLEYYLSGAIVIFVFILGGIWYAFFSLFRYSLVKIRVKY